tara:strand:+ start:1207 stop:1896 length:690 start_codon:yes stop_codon:yes gene_type:complete
MSKKKFISVIMSCFNNEDSIQSSVESILNQSYQEFEFLIVDDCSKDNTFEILNDLNTKDERIKLFKNDKNIGLTKSLNFLISKSHGEYVARQDADDKSKENRFEIQIRNMLNYNLDACSTKALVIGSNRTIPNFSYYLPLGFVLRYKNPIIHGSLIIKSEVLKKINFYDENFLYSQDYELIIRMYNEKFKIKILKDVLYELNMKNNISTINSEQQKYYAQIARKKLRHR